jgi:hypothetical protein
MSGPAFSIIPDDVREPLVARKYARTEGLGRPSLTEAFKSSGSAGEAISMQDFFPTWGLNTTLEDGASFPDDSVLLMIGNTDELVRACKEAEEDAHILAIYTKTHSALTLLYARIKVSRLSGQVDTLIAIGPAQGLLLSASRDWREYRWQGPPPTFVATPDGEPSGLPPVIRWIKQNDGEAWLKD